MRFRRAGALVALAASVVVALGTNAWAEGLAGSAGTDTSLPATDSAATVSGRGSFADLKVSVSQTTGLANQAVSVSWTGGKPSTSYSSDFLQIFQCWGEDDGSNADNPGPPPEQCQQGGQPFAGSVLSRIPAGANPSNVYTRAIANDNWSNFQAEKDAPRDQSRGHLAPDHDPDTGKLWLPFRAVDGIIIPRQLKLTGTTNDAGVNVAWQNPYFEFATTNEDNWQRTYGEGKGAALFQVFTGLEASGLGCGQTRQVLPDGSKKIPKCWLVVVPRATPAAENPSGVEQPYVVTSPLASTAWANRIAFPLEFNPIDSQCSIGSDQRRVVGGELAAGAVVNWQPTLCATEGATPFAFSITGDEQARRQVLAAAPGSAGLAAVTSPVDDAAVDPDNPPVYAPLSLSGVVVGFNVERTPVDYEGNVKDPAEGPLAGLRVTNINLTPRLVAKLLTQSYPRQFPNLLQATPPEGYEWIKGNAEHLFRDQDFVRFNPEFDVMSVGSQQAAGGPIVAGVTADSSRELWRWLLADPEAKAWLDGAADEWGTKVNPLYGDVDEVVPDTFPRNDPYCYQAPVDNDITPRPLCMLDASPLAQSMSLAAQSTRAANDRRTTTHDPLNGSQQTSATYWGSDGPQPAGARSILSVTDTASAARYGLQTASLSRAGDNDADRAFIAPKSAALLEGVKAMKPVGDTKVLLPDPAAVVPGAYPLTMLTYAMTTPRSLDDASKADYSRFVTYAAGDGQKPGLKFGDLPPGYVPLPDALREESRAAAEAIATAKPLTAEEEVAEEAAAAEEERATEPGETPLSLLDVPMASVTVTDMMNELSVPAGSVAPPVVALARPLRSLGDTPKVVAGVLRFAVPTILTIGALAFLLFLVLDTGRLREAVSLLGARDQGHAGLPQ